MLYARSINNRHAGVFTKSRLLGLTSYDKGILLDADIVVRYNMNELFDCPVPCAMRRHAAANSEHGSRMIRLGNRRQDGTLKNGIIAGVMILEPNEHVKDNMLQQVDSDAFSWFIKRMPERDFLTLHFHGK